MDLYTLNVVDSQGKFSSIQAIRCWKFLEFYFGLIFITNHGRMLWRKARTSTYGIEEEFGMKNKSEVRNSNLREINKKLEGKS